MTVHLLDDRPILIVRTCTVRVTYKQQQFVCCVSADLTCGNSDLQRK